MSSRFVAICWLAVLSMLVGGCKPATQEPLSGHLSLMYVGATDSEFLLELENGSAEAVRFVGDRSMWASAVRPEVGTSMDCSKGGTGSLSGFGFADPPPSGTVKVSPGERIRLAVQRGFSSDYKGGHCRIELRLQDGRTVQSNEFAP